MDNPNDRKTSEDVKQLTETHASDEEYEELDDGSVFTENQIKSNNSSCASLDVLGDADFMSVGSMTFKTRSTASDEDFHSNNNSPQPSKSDATAEAVDSEHVQYVGQIDSTSGKLITDPKEILEFIAKMPELSSSHDDDNEQNKFPIPMNPNGNVSVVELEASSEDNANSVSINEAKSPTKTPPLSSSPSSDENDAKIEIISHDQQTPATGVQCIDENDAEIEIISHDQQTPYTLVEYIDEDENGGDDDDEDSNQYEDIVEIIAPNTTTAVDNFIEMTTLEKDSDDDNDADFIEESITERLWGLTEMFPENLVDGTINTISSVKSLTEYLCGKTKCGIWIAVSAFIVVAFPVVIGVETIRMDETQLAQQRQMLVNSGALNSQPGSLEPSPIPL